MPIVAISRALRPDIPLASGLEIRPGRVRGANITTSIADHHSVAEKCKFPLGSPYRSTKNAISLGTFLSIVWIAENRGINLRIKSGNSSSSCGECIA
jgi:hypothetical protein